MENIRDLGVYFDNKLTFKYHINHICRRASLMIGAARRTVNDLNYHMAIINIFKTYILPVILYGSVIWNQDRIGVNNEIVQLFKKVTRIALRTPHDTRHRNYIPFIKRCYILHLNSLEKKPIGFF